MIIIMDNRGRLIGKIGKRGGGDRPGEFRLPTQVAVAGGEVFVLDEANTRVQIFDAAGSFLQAINLAYVEPRSGLTVDNQGHIYVSDPALNEIQVFRHEGQPLYTMDSSAPSKAKTLAILRPCGLTQAIACTWWILRAIIWVYFKSADRMPGFANDRFS